jgi:hypothetical protein
MPRYRMELEVEVVCPISKNDPKNTISAKTVLESLLSTGKNSNGYAVYVTTTTRLHSPRPCT